MPSAIVLGAGMAGVSAALHLQARGWSVVLVDRETPGSATSYGNAGIIQGEAVEPYPMPRDLRSLLAIATGRTNDVRYHVRHLHRHVGPLLRYWWHSAPPRHRLASRAYASLIARAIGAHAPLIDAAGAGALVRRDGFRILHRSQADLDAAAAAAERLGREYGVASRIMAPADLTRAEPQLRAAGAGAVHWLEPWTVSDPGGLVRAYADLFERQGGTIVRADATRLAIAPGGGWRVAGDGGPAEAEHAVVALGPWSPDLTRRFGLRIPMIRKRGYHVHYAGRPLDLPLMDAANGYVMAPMAKGLRITTGAELTGPEAPGTPTQLARAEGAARDLLPLGAAVEEKAWFGSRPCIADMLPVIGAVPGADGLWAHFGHGHQGFTLGPATGELLAELMTTGRAAIDHQPFSPARFGRTAS